MLENGEGFWQDLIKLKYVKETPICLVQHKQTDSPNCDLNPGVVS
jgi:hypothetical protein